MRELITLEDVRSSQRRIASVVVRTGLYCIEPDRLRAAGVAGQLPFTLYIKAESEQPIGSFKLRGAYNRIAQLSAEELARGVVTYSSGNHAQGVAFAARALGAKAVIVMPENAPEVKIAATKALGAEVVLVGAGSKERRAMAEEMAAESGYTIVPPYDDPAIIAGQATCGMEILEQLADQLAEQPREAQHHKTVILSPVSGGGLLSGIAAAVKLSHAARTQVWGAEPELAADAKESFDTRTLVEWPADKTTRTISDGLRTQSLGELNFAHIMEFVDGIVTVSEDEILGAMRIMLAATGLVAEPSGAVTLAAALFHHAELPPCTRMVAVLSGGNIEPEMKQRVGAAVDSA
jgi:threonine dehydratase